jgi:hypothetical protein
MFSSSTLDTILEKTHLDALFNNESGESATPVGANELTVRQKLAIIDTTNSTDYSFYIGVQEALADSVNITEKPTQVTDGVNEIPELRLRILAIGANPQQTGNKSDVVIVRKGVPALAAMPIGDDAMEAATWQAEKENWDKAYEEALISAQEASELIRNTQLEIVGGGSGIYNTIQAGLSALRGNKDVSILIASDLIDNIEPDNITPWAFDNAQAVLILATPDSASEGEKRLALLKEFLQQYSIGLIDYNPEQTTVAVAEFIN